MIATSQPLSEHRRRNDEWVPEVCAQFSDATGWPLRFVPASHFDLQPHSADESCWTAEVRDGKQVIGQLRLDLAHESRNDRAFPAVSQLSGLMAELLEQVFTTKRHLETGTQELQTLVSMGLTVPEGPEILSAIQQLLRVGLQLTGFRSACLFLIDPLRHELRLRATHHLESRNVPQPTRSLQAEPPDLQVLLSGLRTELRRSDSLSDEWLPSDVALGLCLPVQSGCGVLGTLWFYDRRPRSIDAREKHLLDSVATQMASLLERVALHRETAQHTRLRSELQALTEMDTDAPIKTLQQPNFETTWRVSSRFEIGGDLCEAIELSDHEVAILIGDATGNSVPAAVVMTAVHGALAALMADDRSDARDTAQVLEIVNRSLFRTRRLPHFMSLVYGVLDTQTLQFRYTNAGHPSPLLLRDGETLSLDSRGILLGIVEEAKYPSETIELQPRDVLVCYSDGVSEARSADAKFFGRDGVLRALGQPQEEHDSLTLLNRVWNQQTAFAAPGHGDDRSLLVARIS